VEKEVKFHGIGGGNGRFGLRHVKGRGWGKGKGRRRGKRR
jgi:hypothetical protein